MQAELIEGLEVCLDGDAQGIVKANRARQAAQLSVMEEPDISLQEAAAPDPDISDITDPLDVAPERLEIFESMNSIAESIDSDLSAHLEDESLLLSLALQPHLLSCLLLALPAEGISGVLSCCVALRSDVLALLPMTLRLRGQTPGISLRMLARAERALLHDDFASAPAFASQWTRGPSKPPPDRPSYRVLEVCSEAALQALCPLHRLAKLPQQHVALAREGRLHNGSFLVRLCSRDRLRLSESSVHRRHTHFQLDSTSLRSLSPTLGRCRTPLRHDRSPLRLRVRSPRNRLCHRRQI